MIDCGRATQCVGEEAPCRQRRGHVFGWCVAVMLAAAFLMLPLIDPPVAKADVSNEVNPQQLPDNSFIYDTSIADLGGAESYFDNQTVQVTGEVVGDCLRVGGDDERCWITLTSTKPGDASTISVLMTNEQAAKIDTFGKYGMTGTILQVKGAFHLICNEHTGSTDLHADTVLVAAKGRQHPQDFNADLFIPGIFAVGIGFIMMFVLWRMQERRR
ncbi:MAG: hydrolase [Raoultibacter sp.]